jgi:putative ABC transport system ATP-binding protein
VDSWAARWRIVNASMPSASRIASAASAIARSVRRAFLGTASSIGPWLIGRRALQVYDVRLFGRVLIGDTDVSSLSDRDLTLLRRNRLGFIFQTYNLVPTLTAAENIELPLRLGGRRADAEWLAKVVAAVGLADRLGHTPAELSGGQQQRVAAARALITRPEIVFADEPTGALDSRSSGELLRFLRHAVDEYGQTIVMVTHDPIAASYADRVLFLSDGRVVDEMAEPTADRILDAMKGLGE